MIVFSPEAREEEATLTPFRRCYSRRRMGVCASNLTEEEKEAAAHSKSISKGLKKDWENQSVKLLLLGTGGSWCWEVETQARAASRPS